MMVLALVLLAGCHGAQAEVQMPGPSGGPVRALNIGERGSDVDGGQEEAGGDLTPPPGQAASPIPPPGEGPTWTLTSGATSASLRAIPALGHLNHLKSRGRTLALLNAARVGDQPRSSSAALIRSIAASISRRSPFRRARSNISRMFSRARASGGTDGGGEAVMLARLCRECAGNQT